MRLLSLTFPQRNRRAIQADYMGQLSKVQEECREAVDATRSWYIGLDSAEHVCEELLDLMLAAEALYCKMPEEAQREAVRRVIGKGEERGDWTA